MNMKKLLAFAMAASLSVAVFAEEADDDDDEDAEIVETELETLMPRKQVGIWPAYFAIAEIPATDQAPDVIGLRVTIPCSTKQESVTGFDIGLWGRTTYFEGFMLNLLRNDVKDELSGVQVGLYNSAKQADKLGAQVGLWNEAGSIHGVQCGLVNTVGQGEGVQIGIINRAEELYGVQIGIVNVIRDAELQFCPVLNIGF